MYYYKIIKFLIDILRWPKKYDLMVVGLPV